MANDPGWYPDPWRPGQRRWWDGHGWTDHTWDPSAQPATAPHAAYTVQPNPQRDLQDEQRAALWAKRGFVAYFAGRLIGFVVGMVVFAQLADDVRHAIDTNGDVPSNTNSYSLFNLPVSALSILGLVAIVLWTYKASNVAHNLRYPARRSPVWAVVGWFVPVVNLWFPYQVVRDCLAPDNPERRTVKQWWTFYVIGLFVWLPALVVALFSSLAVAVALVVPALVVGIMEVSLALRVVDAIEADHGAAISRVISP